MQHNRHYYASHSFRENFLSIFSLCDLKQYDGLLIQGNRTWPPERRQQFVDAARSLNKPVVSINYELDGASCVGTNNYQEEFELVHRVLKDSGRKHPAFVNGLKTSVEAQDRARGFLDACSDLNILNPRFYQANWQKSAGVATAKKMLRHPDQLPDAIFCCNDDLAVGVQETLQAKGVRVPEDVLVTGFDNREVSSRVRPRITTVDRDYRAIAATALDALIRLIDGEEVPPTLSSPAKHVLSASAGYAPQSEAEHFSVLSEEIEESQRFYETFCSFQFAVQGANTLYATLENGEMFARQLDCANAFLVLYESYLAPDATTPDDTRCRLVACKNGVANLRPDASHIYTRYDRRAILPPQVPMDQPIYTISPLHISDTTLGMFVTVGVPRSMHHGLSGFFLAALAGSIESVRKTELLKELGQG